MQLADSDFPLPAEYLALAGAEPVDGPCLTCLADVQAEPVRFLWPGRIALGKLNIIAGDPGLGKSYLTLAITARVSIGAPWPDCAAPERSDVVILTAEDGLADTVRPRLDTLHADVKRVHALTGVNRAGQEGERIFSLAEDVPRLEEAIQRTRASLVVIDPLNAYLQNVDSHKAADVRSVLAPLSAMAERTGCAVLVVHHLNKSTSANALYRAGGSLDFVAAARSVLGVAKDPDREGRCVLVTVKLNVAAKPEGIGFRIDESGVSFDDDPVTMDAGTAFTPTSRDPDESGSLAEAKDFLTDLLSAGEPVASKAALAQARSAGIAERTVRRAQKALGVRALKQGGAAGAWCWQMAKVAKVANIAKVADEAPLTTFAPNESQTLPPLNMPPAEAMAEFAHNTESRDGVARDLATQEAPAWMPTDAPTATEPAGEDSLALAGGQVAALRDNAIITVNLIRRRFDVDEATAAGLIADMEASGAATRNKVENPGERTVQTWTLTTTKEEA